MAAVLVPRLAVSCRLLPSLAISAALDVRLRLRPAPRTPEERLPPLSPQRQYAGLRPAARAEVDPSVPRPPSPPSPRRRSASASSRWAASTASSARWLEMACSRCAPRRALHSLWMALLTMALLTTAIPTIQVRTSSTSWCSPGACQSDPTMQLIRERIANLTMAAAARGKRAPSWRRHASAHPPASPGARAAGSGQLWWACRTLEERPARMRRDAKVRRRSRGQRLRISEGLNTHRCRRTTRSTYRCSGTRRASSTRFTQVLPCTL